MVGPGGPVSNVQAAKSVTAASSQARVTIIVAPRERFEQAEMSVAALLATADVPFDLIYVDGRSPRAIARELKAAVTGAGHTYIRRETYLSPNQARNIAMPLVKTEYVLFADNDVVFEPRWLSAMVDCADETGAGLVTPTILAGPESRMPNLKVHHAGGHLELVPVPGGLYMERIHQYEDLPFLEIRDQLKRTETGSTEFHVVLARKAMLDEIGPFDEYLMGFTDEIDMALLARRRGWKIYLEPTAVVGYAVGKPLTWRDRPFFCVRWSRRLCMRAERHFYDKWNLVHEFERQRSFLAQHRCHAVPFKKMQAMVGWRASLALTWLFCEAMDLAMAHRMHLPNPEKRPAQARQGTPGVVGTQQFAR